MLRVTNVRPWWRAVAASWASIVGRVTRCRFCQCLDLAPPLCNPFIEWKEPARKTNAEIVIEPTLKCAAPWLILVEEVNALSDLPDGDNAEVHQFLRRRDDPVGDRARGSNLHQLRDDIRVEEVARGGGYHLILLVVSRFRVRSSGRPPPADRKNSRSDSG